MSDTPQLDFDSLTPAQQRALNIIAFSGSYYHPKVLAALEKREMIECVEEVRQERLGTFTVKHYRMPIWAHIQYCEWCSLHGGDEGGAA